MRRAPIALVVTVLGASSYLALAAPGDSASALTPANRSIALSGGPLVGTASSDCSRTPTACADTRVAVSFPSSYWAAHPGGVQVRIQWNNPETELDLLAFDPTGREIASSNYGGRNYQELYLGSPVNGAWTIRVAAVDAVATTFTGLARAVRDDGNPAAQSKGSMAFATSLIDPQVLTNEPSASLAPDGTLYSTAPWGLSSGHSFAWRSTDGGATFTQLVDGVGTKGAPNTQSCTSPAGGADSAAVADRTGRLYFASLAIVGINVAVSTDQGRTWQCHPLANSTPEDDRPWLAAAPTADGSGPGIDAYLSYTDFGLGQLAGIENIKPGAVFLDVTTDGGATWTQQATIASGHQPVPGAVFSTSGETVFQPYQADDGVWIAVSHDGGRTMSTHLVSQRFGNPDNNFVTGAADSAGNLYVAWVDAGSFRVLLCSSQDGGTTWTAPVQLSPPGQASYLPAIAAGRTGDVAVAWYGAATALPQFADDKTAWNVWIARATRADSAHPTYVTSIVSPQPVHRGVLCTINCTGNHSGLADFLGLALRADGAAVLTYGDNGRADTTMNPPYPYLVTARQTAGVGMSRHADSPAEPTGDAGWPVNSPRATNQQALDLTGTPAVSQSAGVVHLTLGVQSTQDLLGALTAGPRGKASDAFWLMVWRAHDQVEYAQAHLTSSGITFAGGSSPSYITDPSGARELVAAYPDTLPLHGTVTAHAITIDVPAASFHLLAHDRLDGLQAFTLTGTGPVSELHLLNVIDSSAGVVGTY